VAKKPPPKPIRLNFTDGAKRRAGVQVSSFETEIQRMKTDRAIERDALKSRIHVLEEGVRLALVAHDEGRRGDCAKTLRRLLPQPPTGPASTPSPPEPRRA
jgi:hypothetical protein